ncbi:MAG: DUF3987 domain-containing protein [Desulfuromonadaceae bacterium]|nr:DUF3987 domain-containing protein [Desulfuromonadaceae bacterium]MDD2856985.1 DUF3987 domain-containing protein [Desulfuromonadaceae bacterium]
MANHIEQFTEYIRNNGCDPKEPIIDDGIFHAHVRDTQDRPGKKDLSYILHGDGVPAGWFCHYSRLPDGMNWQAKADSTLTTEERHQIKARMEQARAAREAALLEVRAACRVKAEKMLAKARDVNADHSYVACHKIVPYGAKQLKDMLLVPLYKAKTLTGLQIITPDSKKFLTGTEKAGAYLAIKGKGKTVYLVEGWADACKIHELTGSHVIVCFDCGNLLEVGNTIRAVGGNDYDMVYVADNDRLAANNPGVTKATAAALATGARLAIPTFPGDDGTDVCDLSRISGNQAVLSCLEAAVVVEVIEEAEQSEITEPDLWPVLSEDATPGWIGEFVALACEHSEADPAAVLVTTLCRFAAEVGADCFVNVGDARHRARTNAVVVGASSKARKGTSAKPVERLFSTIPTGARCTPGPLSSGEGLIYAVRDEVREFDKRSQEQVVTDPGITDKRLFVLDEEFAAALNCTKREGNTLSSIIRGFYDDGNAEPLTKSVRIKATGAHVVIVTHITELELTTLLNQVQMSNGFGNRFLWILSRRQKLMALPSPMPEPVVDRIRQIVVARLDDARNLQTVSMSNDAKKLWTELYPGLTMDYSGIAGSVVNRTEAHAVRLSLIYALCAGHSQIEVEDLKAAVAIVEYSRKSAFKIFGSVSADKRKVKILEALKNAVNNEMSVTEISSKVFNRNMKAEDLRKLLSEMEASKLIVMEKLPAEGNKPKTIVKIKNSERIYELNELSTPCDKTKFVNSLIRKSETEIDTMPDFDF